MSSMIAGVHYPNGVGEMICQICIEWTKVEDLYVDNKGDRWDVCRPCGIKEENYVEIKGYSYGVEGKLASGEWKSLVSDSVRSRFGYDDLETAISALRGFKGRYGSRQSRRYGTGYIEYRLVRRPYGDVEALDV